MASLRDAINIARGYLQDTISTYRYSDFDMTGYGMDAIMLMVAARPELFILPAAIALDAGTFQTLHLNGFGLADITGNKNGEAVRMVDASTLDQFRPGWANDPPAPARHWFRQEGSRMHFYVYPPAKAGDALGIMYIPLPSYTTDQPLDQRLEPYIGPIADYITGACEARESEDAGPQRATMFTQDFLGKIKGGGK